MTSIMVPTVLAVAMIGFVLVTAAVIWLGVQIVGEPWWPTLLYQSPYRGNLISTSLLVVAIGLSVPCAFILPPDASVVGLIVLVVLIGPMLTCRLSAWRAWRHDDPDLRSRAASVRNRRNERMDVPQRASADKPWPSYIIDAERARRQAAYRPPG